MFFWDLAGQPTWIWAQYCGRWEGRRVWGRLLVGCLWVVCGLISVGTTLAQGFKKRAVCKGIEMDNQLGRNVLLSSCVCVGLIV